MDGALDLSDVWERGQVMTAQMAAHQCLGKMLTDMGHASPERLIDRIYLGLHLDILTAKPSAAPQEFERGSEQREAPYNTLRFTGNRKPVDFTQNRQQGVH